MENKIRDKIKALDGILQHSIRIGEEDIQRLIRYKIKEYERELQRERVKRNPPTTID